MRSPMIESAAWIHDKTGYSDLQVLRSPAGWYVGTMFSDEDGCQEPGSRDSGYFRTSQEAQDWLDALESGNQVDGLRRLP